MSSVVRRQRCICYGCHSCCRQNKSKVSRCKEEKNVHDSISHSFCLPILSFIFMYKVCLSVCLSIYIYIYITSSAANQGDNTVSVAQGGTATPGATKQFLPTDRVFFLLNTLSGGKSCLIAAGVAVPPWATETVLSPLISSWWGQGIARAFTRCIMNIYIYIYIYIVYHKSEYTPHISADI